MKRSSFIFIFCLSFILSPFLWAQDDIENEYAYGTITNITDKEILLKEYNYEKEEFVEITYKLLPETKVRNTGSIKSIVTGNQIEILYQEVDGVKNALVVVLETEEGVVEQDNPEKAAAEAAASETPPAAPAAPASAETAPAVPAAETPAAPASEPAAAQIPAADPNTQTVPATEVQPTSDAASTPAAASAPETTAAAAPQTPETLPPATPSAPAEEAAATATENN